MFERVRALFTDLISAAHDGNAGILKYHLTQPGVDVNQTDYKMSALYFTMAYDKKGDHLPCTILLLEAGADPNKGVHEKSNFWRSCLDMHLQLRTDWPMIRLLVSYGADHNRVLSFKNGKSRAYVKTLTNKVIARDQTLEQIKRLSKSNDGKPTLEIIEAYERVGQYWQDLLAEEKQEGEENTPSIILEHYRIKRDFYYNKAQELRTQLQKMSDTASTLQRADESHLTYFSQATFPGELRQRKPSTPSVELKSLR